MKKNKFTFLYTPYIKLYDKLVSEQFFVLICIFKTELGLHFWSFCTSNGLNVLYPGPKQLCNISILRKSYDTNRSNNLFQRAMMGLKSPVGLYWFNAVFWTNVHTCLNRWEIDGENKISCILLCITQMAHWHICKKPIKKYRRSRSAF